MGKGEGAGIGRCTATWPSSPSPHGDPETHAVPGRRQMHRTPSGSPRSQTGRGGRGRLRRTEPGGVGAQSWRAGVRRPPSPGHRGRPAGCGWPTGLGREAQHGNRSWRPPPVPSGVLLPSPRVLPPDGHGDGTEPLGRSKLGAGDGAAAKPASPDQQRRALPRERHCRALQSSVLGPCGGDGPGRQGALRGTSAVTGVAERHLPWRIAKLLALTSLSPLGRRGDSPVSSLASTLEPV